MLVHSLIAAILYSSYKPYIFCYVLHREVSSCMLVNIPRNEVRKEDCCC